MNSISKTLYAAIAIASLTTVGVQANVISGSLWHVPEATAQNAIFANVPGTTPDVTFDVNSPLGFSATSASVSTWLASGGAFNIVENTPGTLGSLMDNGTYGTLLDFVGTVSVLTGDIFTVTHDDGLQLKIGSLLVINQPGPTAPVTQSFTYTGPSGTLPFELVYGECCGGPAVLQISLPLSNTPDGGSTLAMMGGALTLLGMASRRLRA